MDTILDHRHHGCDKVVASRLCLSHKVMRWAKAVGLVDWLLTPVWQPLEHRGTRGWCSSPGQLKFCQHLCPIGDPRRHMAWLVMVG